VTWLTDIIGNIFDLLAGMVGGSALLLMLVVSAITAVWALLLFKAVTPQDKLTETRDRLFGHIYEMGLYQDRLRVVGKIQADLAKANLKYLGLTLPALVVLTIPMVFTLAQLDARFAKRPFYPGETTVLKVVLSENSASSLDRVTLEVPPSITVEAGPVRNRVDGSLAWRLRAEDKGVHQIRLTDGDTEIGVRELVTGEGLIRLGETSNQSWIHGVLYPGAPPLPKDGALKELTLRLPPRHTSYLGMELHWLLAFMIISMVAGLALKDFLRVSI
jgi:uncharacterized membrane protein (DUF106 family)